MSLKEQKNNRKKREKRLNATIKLKNEVTDLILI